MNAKTVINSGINTNAIPAPMITPIDNMLSIPLYRERREDKSKA